MAATSAYYKALNAQPTAAITNDKVTAGPGMVGLLRYYRSGEKSPAPDDHAQMPMATES